MNRLRISFARASEKIMLPLDPLCGNALRARCTDFDLRTADRSLKAAIYSTQGRLVKNGSPTPQGRRVQFNPRGGEQYYLVLAPGPETQINTDYVLELVPN